MAYLSIFGIISVMYLFYALARLSDRLGSVQKMSPIYRLYYVAIAFLAISALAQLLIIHASLSSSIVPAWLVSPWMTLITYHLSMTVGVTIGLIVSWRYWSWLVYHRD
jgi:hypothetical protein